MLNIKDMQEVKELMEASYAQGVLDLGEAVNQQLINCLGKSKVLTDGVIRKEKQWIVDFVKQNTNVQKMLNTFEVKEND